MRRMLCMTVLCFIVFRNKSNGCVQAGVLEMLRLLQM